MSAWICRRCFIQDMIWQISVEFSTSSVATLLLLYELMVCMGGENKSSSEIPSDCTKTREKKNTIQNYYRNVHDLFQQTHKLDRYIWITCAQHMTREFTLPQNYTSENDWAESSLKSRAVKHHYQPEKKVVEEIVTLSMHGIKERNTDIRQKENTDIDQNTWK